MAQIWSDPRYEELSERERRRLFGEYRDVLRAAEREEALVRFQPSMLVTHESRITTSLGCVEVVVS